MMKKWQWAVLLLILVGAIFAIRNAMAPGEDKELGDEEGVRPDSRLASGDLPAASDEAPSSRSKRDAARIDDLVAGGWQVDAKRVGKSSAEGAVSIISPSGTQITGDDLRIGSEGNYFYLTGAIELKQGADRITSVGKDAYIRISTDENELSLSTGPGGWTTEVETK